MTEQNKPSLADLRVPFPAEAIGKLPRGNVQLDYVGHASVTDRLLSVDPHWNWEPLAFDATGLPLYEYKNDKPSGLWIKLTVLGVTRLGYGSVEGNKSEPVKELIGDALRNAAMRFGVALDLWSKAELESQVDADKPKAAAKERPQRPARVVQPPVLIDENGEIQVQTASPSSTAPSTVREAQEQQAQVNRDNAPSEAVMVDADVVRGLITRIGKLGSLKEVLTKQAAAACLPVPRSTRAPMTVDHAAKLEALIAALKAAPTQTEEEPW